MEYKHQDDIGNILQTELKLYEVLVRPKQSLLQILKVVFGSTEMKEKKDIEAVKVDSEETYFTILIFIYFLDLA